MTEQTQEKERKNQPPVVAIGASAGGLEAVTELLKNIPANTGLSYIYVQHLDPTHESSLAAILSREANIPVSEAEDNTKLLPDQVYVIPPNKELQVIDGVMSVSARPELPYAHLPINRLFISLAEQYKELAVGIVLSGTASDGTLGLKAIKMEGGLTFAQDASAKFEGMPKSAIAEGAVDLVLSPSEMAEEIIKFSSQKHVYSNLLQEAQQSIILHDDTHLSGILELLRKSVGADFSQYKMNTIKRRIVRRMMLYKITSVAEYLQFMKQNAKEIKLLYDDLLINVTTFFRDSDTIDYLKTELLPKLIKNKKTAEPIRVWIPACSTGQEAYSIAMLIVEAFGDDVINRSVQIFATDLSEKAITKARAGVYSDDEIVEVSKVRLEKFFRKTDGFFRVSKKIRDLCIFATHNILLDPPFSRLDIISCCNLMIYLDKSLQRKVLATFHYALDQQGFLVLGKSESIGSHTNIFSQIEKKLKIYSKKTDSSSRALFEMNVSVGDLVKNPGKGDEKGIPKAASLQVDLEKAIDDILLKRYTPASVIVTGDLDIVQFRGAIGLFLEPQPGKATLNLVKMAKPGLGFDIRNLIHKAKKTGEKASKNGIEILKGDLMTRINIEAIPLKELKEEYYMVVFEEAAAIPVTPDEQGNNTRVQQLEGEISALREDLRSIVESHEAANEELQSANEEVVSSNEELQSINEELETSKEEIESSNEELMTINQELQVRNEELAESQDYANAVFSTIGESVVILSQDLRVKFANKAFYQTFRVKPEDTEAHLLYEIGSQQWNIPELRDLLQGIFEHNLELKNYEVSYDFPAIGRKIMRLNAVKLIQASRVHPAVILAFEDISEFKLAHENVVNQNRVELVNGISQNIPVMIWMVGLDKLCTYVNRYWCEFTGLSYEQSIQAGWVQSVHPEDLQDVLISYNKSFQQKKLFKCRCRLRAANGSYKDVMVSANPNVDANNNFMGYIGGCVPIA